MCKSTAAFSNKQNKIPTIKEKYLKRTSVMPYVHYTMCNDHLQSSKFLQIIFACYVHLKYFSITALFSVCYLYLVAYEKATKEQRMRTEISQAKKEANFYLQNVEKGKAIDAMETRKRKRADQVKLMYTILHLVRRVKRSTTSLFVPWDFVLLVLLPAAVS